MSKAILAAIKKLGIEDSEPQHPGLFSYHQTVGAAINNEIMHFRANAHAERLICDDLIEPIP